MTNTRVFPSGKSAPVFEANQIESISPKCTSKHCFRFDKHLWAFNDFLLGVDIRRGASKKLPNVL